MKQLPRIAATLFCEPWSILPGAHSQICRQFRAYLTKGDFPAPVALLPATPVNDCEDPVGPCIRNDDGSVKPLHSQVRRLGSIAILPIHGIIGKHIGMLEMMCGGTDSAVIAKQAQAIAADDRIATVIVHIDSPGGICVGAPECARAILSMSEAGKEVIAYTDTQAASNGYFMAAACGSILAAPSAVVGSISTYCAFEDESAAYAMEGVEIQMFRTGEVKGSGTEGKPWTPAEKAAMQLVTDQFGEQFKSFIRARRGLGDDLMQGQFWPAEFAPAGLVDGFVDDLDTLLAMVASSSPQ